MMAVVVAAALMLVAGCGRAAGGADDAGDAGSGGGRQSVDETLTAMESLLRSRYGQWYAGTSAEGGDVVVYRRPGSDLDQVVRDRFDVTVRFADARLSEKEMRALSDRVVADTGFWKDKGITVTGAGPLPDGSAVGVMTADGAAGEAETLSRHYGKPVVVERGSAELAPYSGDPPVITPSGSPEK